MATLDLVRRITSRISAEGADKATSDLKRFADAHGNVATVSEKSAKATLSAQNALERQQRSLDSNYRATQSYQKSVADLERAHAQGLTTLQRHNELMKLAADRYGQGGVASTSFKNALGGVQGQLVALSAGAGPVGVFLAGLGPWGVAAAVGLGATVGAFSKLRDLAADVGASSSNLRNFSETTGLTITQLKGLEKAGAAVGVENEQTVAFVERFTVELEHLRRGSGSLYDELIRLDPQLVQQMQLSRGAAEAYDLWARAIARADQEQRNLLARAAGGRNGIQNVRTALAVDAAGGINSLPAGTGGTEAEIKRWDELHKKIVEVDNATKGIWSRMFATEILEGELRFSNVLNDIAKTAREFKASGDLNRVLGLMGGLPLVGPLATGLRALSRPDAKPGAEEWPIAPLWQGPLQGGPDPRKQTPEALAKDLKTQMSILGSAATTAEQLRLKQAELNAEVAASGGKYGGLAERAMQAYRIAASGADLAIRVQNGAATATELYAQRQRELQQLVREQKLTQDQANASLAAYGKTVEQTVNQMEVFKAQLPGLKQLEQEFGSTRTQLDQFTVGSMNNLVTGLADITTGTKSAKDGFRDLGLQVIRSLEEMLIKMLIIAPIARSLQSTLGGLVGGGGGLLGSLLPVTRSANGNAFDRGNVIPFAQGGVVDRPIIFPMANGAGLMGEAGPEAVMPLKRGPDGRLGVSGGGGGGARIININSTYQIDGAVGKEELAQAIKQSHDQAVQKAVAISNGMMPSRQDSYNRLGT